MDRRKDELLAMLAHELRNPLAAIMTAIGILERKPSDDAKETRMRGIGVPADVLPYIFDLFAQADTSLERSRGGLGIGLTLVRKLVRMHGGEVQAFSDGPGRGSEFVVKLPLLHEASVPADSGKSADARRGRRILLVEDNSDARQAMRDLLELWGHQVTVAPDGLQGLAMALTQSPELALVDIGLPGMDGYRVVLSAL